MDWQFNDLLKVAYNFSKLNVHKGDRFVIVTDTAIDHSVPYSFFIAGNLLGAETSLCLMEPRPTHGYEPPEPITRALEASNVFFAIASTSISHTQARIRACQAGARYITMPGLTPGMMLSGASQADYAKVAKVSNRIAQILTKGQNVKITSPLGTDFEVSIAGRIAQSCAGIAEKEGQIACFPDGETPIAPVEGTARGKIVFDLSMQGVGLLSHPIELLVENGRVIDIHGDKEADALIEIIKTKGDDNSYCIGEVSIGTNPLAGITGNVSEDKKGAGRVHIALGENTSFGGGKLNIAGKIHSKIHLDGVIKKPTVYVDDTLVVDQGEIIS